MYRYIFFNFIYLANTSAREISNERRDNDELFINANSTVDFD